MAHAFFFFTLTDDSNRHSIREAWVIQAENSTKALRRLEEIFQQSGRIFKPGGNTGTGRQVKDSRLDTMRDITCFGVMSEVPPQHRHISIAMSDSRFIMAASAKSQAGSVKQIGEDIDNELSKNDKDELKIFTYEILS